MERVEEETLFAQWRRWRRHTTLTFIITSNIVLEQRLDENWSDEQFVELATWREKLQDLIYENEFIGITGWRLHTMSPFLGKHQTMPPCGIDFFMPNTKEHEKTTSFLEKTNAMDQSTYAVRMINWLNIIKQCHNRPAGISAQWLAENDINEKSYYYWLRKIRREAYEHGIEFPEECRKPCHS